ncbi:c-type cytochrome [Caldimonas brevitalea]|uniref:Cytochrome C n=1 Tax=Caldimonas brevitalea TaxID=413882 RepID=A0A0G3BWI1_9BURK|nr:cytochrome c [Caldimonas brevitalea]AKJ30880.1 cytochrome C [Caldimonas brevitalea]
MNKRQSRLFAIACTGIAAVVFLGLTVDSHRQFPTLTNEAQLTPQVIAGKDVWHKYNCVNCHTLFGEGAYYAPDLTKIAKHRGEQYLQAYMRNPAQFYDEQRHRRLMPKQDLSDEEIKNLIDFLGWVSNVDNQGWPPRPILVTGATIPGTDMTASQQAQTSGEQTTTGQVPPGARPLTGNENPIALGERLFRSVTPACNACHSVAQGANMAGPSLAGLTAKASQLVGSPDYKGKAKDPEGYIRESIVDPSAHVVPGAMYSANNMSFMPNTYGQSLKPEQVDQLVAYLSSIK